MASNMRVEIARVSEPYSEEDIAADELTPDLFVRHGNVVINIVRTQTEKDVRARKINASIEAVCKRHGIQCIDIRYKGRQGMRLQRVYAGDVLASMIGDGTTREFVNSKKNVGKVEIAIQEKYGDDARMEVFDALYYDVAQDGFAWHYTRSISAWHIILGTVAMPCISDMPKAIHMGTCMFTVHDNVPVIRMSSMYLVNAIDGVDTVIVQNIAELIKYGEWLLMPSRAVVVSRGQPSTVRQRAAVTRPKRATKGDPMGITKWLLAHQDAVAPDPQCSPLPETYEMQTDQQTLPRAPPVVTAQEDAQVPTLKQKRPPALSVSEPLVNTPEKKRVKYRALAPDDPIWAILKFADDERTRRMRDAYSEGRTGTPLPAYPSPHINPFELSRDAQKLVDEKNAIQAEIRTMEKRLAVLHGRHRAILQWQNTLRDECVELEPTFECAVIKLDTTADADASCTPMCN